MLYNFRFYQSLEHAKKIFICVEISFYVPKQLREQNRDAIDECKIHENHQY